MNQYIKQFMAITVLTATSVATVQAATLGTQQQYKFVMKELEKNTLPAETLQQAMSSLKTYPLYPYLQAKYLSNNLSTANFDDVNRFLAKYPTLAVNQSLKTAFAKTLINRNEWQKVSTLLAQPETVIDRCQFNYAQFMLGNKKIALAAAEELWMSSLDRPSGCNPLFDVYRQSSIFSTNTVLTRIGVAMEARNRKLTQYLIGLLPDSQQRLKTSLKNMSDKPETLTEFTKNVQPSGFSYHIVHAVFPQFARKNAIQAQAALPAIVKNQKIAASDKLMLEKSIAVNLMKESITSSQATWRDKIIAQTRDENLIERRIRMKLAKGNIRQIEKWIDLLPEQAKKKEEWVYWKARVLMTKGDNKNGKALLRSLLPIRGFYSMLSAQRLGVAYPFDKINNKFKGDNKLLNSLNNDDTIIRIRELLETNMLAYAMREWRSLLETQNEETIATLAHYALKQNWGMLSVQATISGKLWNNFDERFPLGYASLFKSALKDKDISYSYAIAITRQESALHPEVMSPAGARGLMQLMPATAKETAKKIQLTNYSSVYQLLEPKTNIQLGTGYLNMLFQSFDNNRILSSAAYNAGPSRVKQWLNASNGQLNVEAFVESIPFNETRNYVKNVLMYDFIYQYLMGKQPKALLTQNEINRSY